MTSDVKGYVVRGTRNGVRVFSIGGDGDFSEQGVDPNYPWPFDTVGSASGAADDMTRLGCTDVSIFRVFADGREEKLPDLEEALAEIKRLRQENIDDRGMYDAQLANVAHERDEARAAVARLNAELAKLGAIKSVELAPVIERFTAAFGADIPQAPNGKSAGQFAAKIACVHCGDGVEIPLSTREEQKDHWLDEGQRLTCESCGGVNVAVVGEEDAAYFADCEDERCAACGRAPSAAADGEERRRVTTPTQPLARGLILRKATRGSVEISVVLGPSKLTPDAVDMLIGWVTDPGVAGIATVSFAQIERGIWRVAPKHDAAAARVNLAVPERDRTGRILTAVDAVVLTEPLGPPLSLPIAQPWTEEAQRIVDTTPEDRAT